MNKFHFCHHCLRLGDTGRYEISLQDPSSVEIFSSWEEKFFISPRPCNYARLSPPGYQVKYSSRFGQIRPSHFGLRSSGKLTESQWRRGDVRPKQTPDEIEYLFDLYCIARILSHKKKITLLRGDTKFLFKTLQVLKYFHHKKRNFLSPRDHVISIFLLLY